MSGSRAPMKPPLSHGKGSVIADKLLVPLLDEANPDHSPARAVTRREYPLVGRYRQVRWPLRARAARWREAPCRRDHPRRPAAAQTEIARTGRGASSEEHTSELQSLM